MAVVVADEVKRSVTTSSVDSSIIGATITYWATNDDGTAFDVSSGIPSALASAIASAVPTSYAGIPFRKIDYEIDNPYEIKATASFAPITRSFGGDPVQEVDQFTSEFSATLETQRVERSISTVASYRNGGGSPPDFGRAINRRPDGTIDGIDVGFPIGTITERYLELQSSVSDLFNATNAAAVGGVNNAVFRGYSAGEVLFTGYRYREIDDVNCELQYDFSIRLNETGVAVGGITGISVDGWDVLWVNWAPTVSNDLIGAEALSAYVERVYPRITMSALFLA